MILKIPSNNLKIMIYLVLNICFANVNYCYSKHPRVHLQTFQLVMKIVKFAPKQFKSY